jgi:uncharacterized protein YbjT (DUF2867 family)
VLDLANVQTFSARKAVAHFTGASRRIGEAGAAAGVRHLVVLGIVNSDTVPFAYYKGKVAQERTAEAGPLPHTIVRATQLHEFGAQVASGAKLGRLSFVPDMLVQPIAADEVARALAEIVEAGPAGRVPDIAGPSQERLPDMARRLLAHRGERRRVVGFRLPGATGRALAGGGQLPGPDVVVRGPSFTDWLRTQPVTAK